MAISAQIVILFYSAASTLWANGDLKINIKPHPVKKIALGVVVSIIMVIFATASRP